MSDGQTMSDGPGPAGEVAAEVLPLIKIEPDDIAGNHAAVMQPPIEHMVQEAVMKALRSFPLGSMPPGGH